MYLCFESAGDQYIDCVVSGVPSCPPNVQFYHIIFIVVQKIVKRLRKWYSKYSIKFDKCKRIQNWINPVTLWRLFWDAQFLEKAEAYCRFEKQPQSQLMPCFFQALRGSLPFKLRSKLSRCSLLLKPMWSLSWHKCTYSTASNWFVWLVKTQISWRLYHERLSWY